MNYPYFMAIFSKDIVTTSSSVSSLTIEIAAIVEGEDTPQPMRK
jgi:hypothetical protein